MKRIKFYYNSGFVGAKRSEIIEVEDDTTEEELNEMMQDWLANHIDYGWHEVEDEEKN